MRFIISLFFIITTISIYANPKIKLPETTKHFGEVLPNSKHKHTFIIENEGKTNLIISKVHPGCGCTVANLSSKIIEPGKSAKLAIDYKAPPNDSIIKKSITLKTNDVSNIKTVLWVEAIIKSNFKPSTTSIQLGNVVMGDKKKFSFTIKPNRGLPFVPNKIKFNKRFLSVNYQKLDEKNPLTDYKFEAIYDSTIKLKPRRIKEKISIYPNKDNEEEVIIINVNGTVTGLIHQSIKGYVTSIKQGDKSQKKAKLNHLRKEKFKITKITSSNKMVTTDIIKISDHEYDILINMKEGGTKRRENVTLLIHTDNPIQKVIRISGTYMFTPN